VSLYPPQQDGESCLPLSEWHRSDVFAVQIEEIEQKNTSPAALPASDANWIMLKEVMPSGPTPHSSPSR
jgi:hypothetical protein